MKNKFLFILLFILAFGFISAVAITDDLHLNIQTTDTSGNIVTGTFDFVFNISNTSDCSNIIYTNSTSLTTDSRGIISYYLPNVSSLDYDQQYWLCYYRGGQLISNSKIARIPYAFRGRNVTLSGIEVDSNFDLGSYNFTTLGRVGIGTINPGAKLEVAGEAIIGAHDGADKLYINRYASVSSDNAYIVAGDVDRNTGVGMTFQVRNNAGSLANAINILNNSNVGIGDTTPGKKLDVAGTGRFYSSSNAGEINFGSGSQAKIVVATPSFSTMSFDIWDGAGYTSPLFMEITGVGTSNIGIGTATPLDDVGTSAGDFSGTGLHVKGATIGRLILEADNPTLILADVGGAVDDKIGGFYLTQGAFKFRSYNDSADLRLDDILVLDLNGNVGMGTATPAHDLQIGDGSEVDVSMALKGNVNNNVSLIFEADDGSDRFKINANLSTSTGEDLLIFTDYQDENNLLVLKGDGNVGIGTANPTVKLEINGSIKITDGNQSANKVLTSDASGVGSWQPVSAVPSGAILMFNSSCPSGYTYVTALENKFPRGSTSYGSTGGSDNAIAVSHSHTFTGSALGTHGHTFSGSALGTHGHTDTFAFSGTAMGTHGHTDTFAFSGNALAGHSHTFTGSALGTHRHTLRGYASSTGGSVSYISSGASPYTINMDTIGITTNDLSPALGLTSAGTPAGSINSVSAGTPAGSITGAVTVASAGTPAGSITGDVTAGSAGTPAGSVTGSVTAASAGTPAGTLNSVSAGTPAGTISTDGSSGTGANVPAYVTVVFCMKD